MPSASRPNKKSPAAENTPADEKAPAVRKAASERREPPAKRETAPGKAAGRRARSGSRKEKKELPTELAAPSESVSERISRWWHRGFRTSSFNAIYGIFLLGPGWVLTQTFFGMFSQASAKRPFWVGEEFWFFALGATLWVLWFFGSIWSLGFPRPLRVYVFGHELTHAIWVWLWGGKVYEKQWWSRDGGYIITDTHNFWIALAPYFYPLYSLVIIVLFGAGSIFYNLTNSTVTFLLMTPLQWLFLLLGASWAFHLSFTFWMIPKGQTDLTSHGTFFSLVVIYMMNIVLLSVFLIVAAPELTFAGFGQELLVHAEDLSEMAYNGMQQWLAPN